ncbi:MAG: WYL domain-containing transcriptional regulator [Opitutales bacterium]|nr:WYL domain-containing transcriptional regulator [Opitutales bacterium]
MPKQSNNNSLARQWEMLRIIPARKPGITAQELAGRIAGMGYEVSKRTVERDLRDLSTLFPLAASEDSAPFRWYWLKDIASEFGGVEVSDAVSLTLAEGVLKSVLPAQMLRVLSPKFELARKKLAALDNLPISKWSSKVCYMGDSLNFEPVKIRGEIIEKIHSALVDGLKISAGYYPMHQPLKQYILNPLGFVQRGARGYLVACKQGDERIVPFAVQRFKSVEILGEHAEKPKDFDFGKYIESGAMNFGGGKMMRLKAVVSEALATYLNEAAISPDQKISYKNGGWRLEATVRDSWQLWFWLRSQGSDITVIQPKYLRENIVESLKEALKNYE